jgi:hypothetical protein
VNREQLRRALNRRNEATHPVELPDPVDEEAFFLGQRAREANAVLQRVTGNPPCAWRDVRDELDETTLVEVQVGTGSPHVTGANGLGLCDVCGQPDADGDPVGHFKHPDQLGEYVLAHGDCGEANGLELA